MGPLLTKHWPAMALAATWAAASVCAQSDRSDRNEFYFDASAGYVSADTNLNTWTEGGFSKLRYSDDDFEAFRMFGEYHGRISPTLRARYLLELNGVDAALETNTAMPADFLTRQLELREALEEAEAKKDPGALERLRAALRGESETLQSALGEQLDARRDYPAAAGLVRKLMFLDRLDTELDAAFETMDD